MYYFYCTELEKSNDTKTTEKTPESNNNSTTLIILLAIFIVFVVICILYFVLLYYEYIGKSEKMSLFMIIIGLIGIICGGIGLSIYGDSNNLFAMKAIGMTMYIIFGTLFLGFCYLFMRKIFGTAY